MVLPPVFTAPDPIPSRMMLNFSRASRLLLTTILVLTTSGCILSRLWKTHSQLCCETPRIRFHHVPQGQTQIFFEAPTLLDRDVIWLMGAEAFEETLSPDGKKLTYKAVPVGLDPTWNTTLVWHLYFHKIEEGYRLSRIELPPVFHTLFSDEFMGQALSAACRLRADVLRKKISIDLSGIDRKGLPFKSEAVSLLGPPNAESEFAGGVAYRYTLTPPPGSTVSGPVAKVDTCFDPHGLVERVEAHYTRYTIQADFSTGTAMAWIH
jgi:hypothetical protein